MNARAEAVPLQLYIVCCDRPDFAREAIQPVLRQSTNRFQILTSDNSTRCPTELVAPCVFGTELPAASPYMRVLERLYQCLNDASAVSIPALQSLRGAA